MSDVLSSEDLDLIFREARTHSVWLDKPVEDALLEQVYDLAKMGPTSANMCPMRIILVKSRAAKERLKPALDAGNVDKTMKAPVTAIIGMDIHFYEKLPKLFPREREVVVQGPAGERAGVHRAAELFAAGRVLHAGRSGAGARLRPDVGVRQRKGGRGVLRRDDGQIQFPLQPRLRRCEQTLSTLTAPQL